MSSYSSYNTKKELKVGKYPGLIKMGKLINEI